MCRTSVTQALTSLAYEGRHVSVAEPDRSMPKESDACGRCATRGMLWRPVWAARGRGPLWRPALAGPCSVVEADWARTSPPHVHAVERRFECVAFVGRHNDWRDAAW